MWRMEGWERQQDEAGDGQCWAWWAMADFGLYPEVDERLLKCVKQEDGIIRYAFIKDQSGCSVENRWREAQMTVGRLLNHLG